MMKIAVLDDYQGVALSFADWSPVQARAEVTVLREHIGATEALIERLLPFDAVCIMRERTRLSRAILERLPNLKFIGSTAPRNAAIDLDAAKARGITVCSTGYTSNGAMELTWALILAAARNLPAEFASVQRGGWQTSIGRDLQGSTIGIMGLGRIGQRIAAVARAFGMEVVAWSQNLTREAAESAGAELVDKEGLLRRADFLSLHLILSGRTTGIVGAAELALMKPTAWLVNTARGPLVDEAALLAALERRAIAGAALDVFDTEPLPLAHPLRSMPNVLLTPHVGYVTSNTYAIFFRDTVENLLAWLDGAPIRVM